MSAYAEQRIDRICKELGSMRKRKAREWSCVDDSIEAANSVQYPMTTAEGAACKSYTIGVSLTVGC